MKTLNCFFHTTIEKLCNFVKIIPLFHLVLHQQYYVFQYLLHLLVNIMNVSNWQLNRRNFGLKFKLWTQQFSRKIIHATSVLEQWIYRGISLRPAERHSRNFIKQRMMKNGKSLFWHAQQGDCGPLPLFQLLMSSCH